MTVKWKALLALFCSCLVLCAALVNSKAPVWSLQDTNDVTHKSDQFAGHPLLIIGGDKHTIESNNTWGEHLVKACGGSFSALGVADTSAAPRFFRGHVKSDLKSQVAARQASIKDVPLLLDWEGTVAHALEFKAAVSNVVLISPGGVIRFVTSGPVSEEGVKSVCAAARAPK